MVHLKNYYSNNDVKLLKWCRLLENYAGLIQDLFLLPQIVGNGLWHPQGKPLRKLYYLGFTMIWLLLHAYEYARDPVPNPKNNYDEFQYLGVDLYAKLGNITVGVIVPVLAAIVYIQQRFNCQKCSHMVKPEECEDLTSKSDLCESLLSG